MPYEVIKRVGNRAYRYSVSSYRDPESGKSKGTWTYLGRVADTAKHTPKARLPGASTRDALLGAFESLLEKSSFDAITVEAIAAAAKVAHATFYRHFENKRDVMLTAAKRMVDRIDSGGLLHAGSDADAERMRIRTFVRTTLTNQRAAGGGILRAIFEARFYDAKVSAFWEELEASPRRVIRRYVEELNANGLGHGDDPERLTSTVLTISHGIINEVSLRRGALGDEEIEPLADVIGRILVRCRSAG
jgi:AcrR family transcriptional regulator